MRIVVALGGNALLRRGEPMTAEAQRANVRVAARALAKIQPGNQLVITHGNGPQVGLLAHAARDVHIRLLLGDRLELAPALIAREAGRATRQFLALHAAPGERPKIRSI